MVTFIVGFLIGAAAVWFYKAKAVAAVEAEIEVLKAKLKR
jgi:uncharacterized membrane-anchored protein YhcB (DUF1043 family)